MPREREKPVDTVIDWNIDGHGLVHCDGIGCDETHPLEHECLGEPEFGTGRWLGWLYLDLNRPDLFSRPLRFCGVRCLEWWVDRVKVQSTPAFHEGGREPTALDRALQLPHDAFARQAASVRVRTQPEEV